MDVSHKMDPSHCGLFALVSYIPDPLGSFLDEMRRSLPGYEFAQAHITILPPRQLACAPDCAGGQAYECLRNFTSFEVSFCPIRRFESTRMLYLPLAAGNAAVNQMHDDLNAGELAAEEEFQFLPHVTLGGPIPAHDLDQAEAAAAALWESCQHPKHFRVEEVVALLAVPNGGLGYGDWTCLWRYTLASNQAPRTIAAP